MGITNPGANTIDKGADVSNKGGFQPNSIAGLVGWWDASKLTGLLNGASVQNWPDSSGNGNTLTQVIGAAQPIYTTNAVNGNPALGFTASSQQNIAGSFTQAQPNTYAGVCRTITGTPSGRIMDSGNANRQLIDVGDPTATDQMYAGTVLSGGFIALGTHVVTAVFNGVSSFMRIDGTQVISGNPGANSITAMALGGSTSNTFMTGFVCEFMIYSGALTVAQLTQIENYLTTKWG